MGFHDPDLHSKVSLALTEATGNAVRHAYPEGATGDVHVAVDRTAEGIVIVVGDHGVGMRNGDGNAGSLGVGLMLMRAETASLAIESDATGTTVTLRFLAQPDQP
jgi:anti-sigma regulatory factor (Ser/Thr protein kinase)